MFLQPSKTASLIVWKKWSKRSCCVIWAWWGCPPVIDRRFWGNIRHFYAHLGYLYSYFAGTRVPTMWAIYRRYTKREQIPGKQSTGRDPSIPPTHRTAAGIFLNLFLNKISCNLSLLAGQKAGRGSIINFSLVLCKISFGNATLSMMDIQCKYSGYPGCIYLNVELGDLIWFHNFILFWNFRGE